MLKQSLALLLSFLLVFGLAACGIKTELEEDIREDLSWMVSQEKIESGESLSKEEASSVAEISSETVISVEKETFSSITAQDASSVITSKTESTASTAKDTATSSTESIYEMPPEDDFNGDTVNELIAWIKSKSHSTSSVLQPGNATGNGVGSSAAQQTILVPQAVNEDLSSYGITVPEDSDSCVYYFRTYESDTINENQLYSVVIKPIADQSKPLADMIDITSSRKEAMQSGTYKWVDYVYVDGYDSTDKSKRIFATAWFVKGDFLVSITASWANAFQPWNTDYFDYFDFETITF